MSVHKFPQGAFTHQDFMGHKGKLEAGDVQVDFGCLFQHA